MATTYDKKAARVGCIIMLIALIMTGLATYGAVQLVKNHLIPLLS